MVENRNKRLDESIWEYHQRIFEETGLKTNFEALLPIECKHYKEFPNGRRISTETSVATKIKDGFEIKELICTLCGKPTHIKIQKAGGR